jgi:hypothetical protein
MHAYRIVVAVPTKNRLAFSPPALVGWSLVELASGSVEARGSARSWSRVGCSARRGLIVRCFIFALYVELGSKPRKRSVVWCILTAQPQYI